MAPSVGFIGGGRVTRVFLKGWVRSAYWPARVVVSDTSATALDAVRAIAPEAVPVLGDNLVPAGQQVVFLALHPPALRTVMAELPGRLPAASLVVSLAPKVTIGEISAALGPSTRVARVIPNRRSIQGRLPDSPRSHLRQDPAGRGCVTRGSMK